MLIEDDLGANKEHMFKFGGVKRVEMNHDKFEEKTF